MHQLITEDAVVVANVITEDAVTGAVAGALLRFFPPIPSNTIKVMTLGIQATLSYLSEKCQCQEKHSHTLPTDQCKTLYPQKVT